MHKERTWKGFCKWHVQHQSEGGFVSQDPEITFFFLESCSERLVILLLKLLCLGQENEHEGFRK